MRSFAQIYNFMAHTRINNINMSNTKCVQTQNMIINQKVKHKKTNNI